jgi:hypothetical protein
VTPSEFDSIIQMVQSQLDNSIEAYFASRSSG